MFVKNAWYNAGWDHMFTQSQRSGLSQSKGSLVSRKIAGERVVVYRKPTGQIVAMEDRCPHRQAALSLGQKEGDGIRCLYHGMRFGADGKCNEIPGQETIPERACVRVFPTIEKDNWVWVWMGDPAKADEKLIPHAVGPGDPEWNVKTSQMHVTANYRLEIANLADLTHLAWIHQQTLGAPDPTTRDRYTHIKPKFTMFPHAMRTQYNVRGVPINTFLSHLFPPGMLFDLDFDIMHTLPCTWVLRFKAFVADGQDEGAPTGQLIADTWTSQAVTPCDEDEVDYYYSWGASKDCEFAGLSQLLCDNLDDAFTEDRHALEAQHLRMKEKPNFPMVDIIHDAGPGKMLWLLDKHLKAEAKEAAAITA
uniref:Vanillate O-demethylase oxygenase subuni n=1 Tax=uncultured bacterium 16 TaxID=1748268 RepID=A0A0U3JBF4_9BACT|nr:vanillate O-demethylase oxygenase subuni [uncultured bacterium 16]